MTAGSPRRGEADRTAVEKAPLRFKQALVRLHPGERRGVSLLVDPTRIVPGTPMHVAVDPGLGVDLSCDVVPEPNRSGRSRIDANLRCRVSAEPGARLSVLAEAGGHTAELVVLVVRHHATGWVREIARKDEDAEIEAHFDPETGVVTVYEGRREFKALERAARRSGLSKARVREYLPYRMLEVEVAANTLYAWAAEEILARRLAEERPADPAHYAAAIRREAQALRYRAHDKLMRAFLDDAVYDGRVRVQAEDRPRTAQQALLADSIPIARSAHRPARPRGRARGAAVSRPRRAHPCSALVVPRTPRRPEEHKINKRPHDCERLIEGKRGGKQRAFRLGR